MEIRDRRIAKAVAMMESRLMDDWNVQTLATSVNLSPSHFAHLFRRCVGSSPLQYLQQLRITRARHLLERTSLSVRDVMRVVGARDASHFSRRFREEFGTSPREHRCQFGISRSATNG